MSISPLTNALTESHHAADNAVRGGVGGLTSPREAAGQFAAMMAGLNVGGSAGEGMAASGSSGDAPDGAQGVPGASASAQLDGLHGDQDGEQRVSGAAVTLLMAGQTGDTATSSNAATVSTLASRRLRNAAEDVSGKVVETAIAAGTPSDGRWMAMLLATGPEAS